MVRPSDHPTFLPGVGDFVNERPFPYGPAGFTASGIPPEIFEGKKGFSCEPCWAKRLKAILDCSGKFLFDYVLTKLDIKDFFKCTGGGLECISNLVLDGVLGRPVSPTQGYGCTKAGISCLKALGNKIGWYSVVKYLECEWKILDACRAPALPVLADSQPPALKTLPELDGLRTKVERLQSCVDFYAYLLGDPAWFQAPESDRLDQVLAAFLSSIDEAGDAGPRISSSEQDQMLALALPSTVSQAQLVATIARWNRTLDYWDSDIYLASQVPPGGSTDFIELATWKALALHARDALAQSEAEGYPDLFSAIESAKADLVDRLNAPDTGSVCAKVRLRLDQSAVLSRDAFSAVLEVENATDSLLEEVAFSLRVSRRDGTDTTAQFELRTPVLTGVSAVDGSGIIPGGTTATISQIVVPGSDAAPAGPTEHRITASLQYRQNGILVTIPLSAVPITVLPNPSLTVRYFHERDVFSDDPFTPEIEPAIPFSLAVMVENHGAGAARAMRITSAQPRIVENEKGLLVDFEILATQVGSNALSPSLTVDLGDIQPGGFALGQWLMRASLQGLFTDYRATFQHVDGKGGQRLSLIDHVEIHEMIHLVYADGQADDGLPDFLVNDLPDPDSAPDTLWLSSGVKMPVAWSTNGVVDHAITLTSPSTTVTLPARAGWNCWSIPDPGHGDYRLVRVQREDGTLVREENRWVTDRTFVGFARPPLREHRVHLFDSSSSEGPVRYQLVYEPASQVADTTPPVAHVLGLPARSAEEFPVLWQGQDNPAGTGLAFIDVFVSPDGGPFTNWIAHTTSAGAVFSGRPGSRYAFYARATDLAGNVQPAPSLPDAETQIQITNHPPRLVPGPDLVVDEGSLVELPVVVADEDQPDQSMTFALQTGAPPGVTIDSHTGRIGWTTGEASGPSTNQIRVTVTDNGVPPLSSTGLVTIIVREVNSAPVLGTLTPRTLNEGALLIVDPVAVDTDLPRQRLSFSLGAGAPPGVGIDPDNGRVTWRPTETQGGTTNRINVIVHDDGVPSLAATQSLVVVVRDTLRDFSLSLGRTNVFAGDPGRVPLSVGTGVELSELSFGLQLDPEQLTDLGLSHLHPGVAVATMQPGEAGSFLVHLLARPDNLFYGTMQLGEFQFTSTPGRSSMVELRLKAVGGLQATGGLLNKVATRDGRVVVIGPEPILDATRTVAGDWSLVLYGRPGMHARIERADQLETPVHWAAFEEGTLPAEALVIIQLPTSTDAINLYRAVADAPSSPRP
jgi:hypothetical protein